MAISHIAPSWDALRHVAVSVQALVFGCADALFSWCAIGRQCLLVHTRFCWGVVHEGDWGAMPHLVASRDDAHLRKHAGVLQVAVGDGARQVVS